MAKMFPKSIEAYNCTKSEKALYYALQQQLDNEINVFYSVSWLNIDNGRREMSEVDFLVFDPRYGFLTIEVKGGQGIKVLDGEWYIVDDKYERKLKKSPFDQAEKNMWYFTSYYQDQYNFPYEGTHGYLVAFPNFVIDSMEVMDNRTSDIILDFRDMGNLNDKIRKAFIFWSGNFARKRKYLTEDQRTRFIKLVQKRMALSASAGALIEDRERQLEMINRVQDNYIRFLINYKQVLIKGGAGTGKTWIAIKYAIKSVESNKRTLICCSSNHLKKFFSDKLKEYSCEVFNVDDLIEKYAMNQQLDKIEFSTWISKVDTVHVDKYDTIIIDEAQDFTENDALFLRMHLKDQKNSSLYVFYDDTQNLYESNFADGFLIDAPPFILQENLRNTSSIYKWATDKTSLGMDVITNPIEGPKPESRMFKTIHDAYNAIENVLIELILKEAVDSSFIAIIVDDEILDIFNYNHIGNWKFVEEYNSSGNEIKLFKTSDFKGLESNVILYIKSKRTKAVFDYVAYTRAKFYLYEFIVSI